MLKRAGEPSPALQLPAFTKLADDRWLAGGSYRGSSGAQESNTSSGCRTGLKWTFEGGGFTAGAPCRR